MKQGPIYIYDVRTQFQEPIVVVYDTDHVDRVLKSLVSLVDRDHVITSRTRLHPYETDRYKSMGSQGLKKPKA